jgi:poly(A) polymerase
MMLKRIRDLFNRRGRESPDVPSESVAGGDAIPVHHGPKVVHRPIPLGDLDDDAVKIVQRLTRFDHSAYLVGGCVRDLLLDRRPKDFDIGTSATPRQVKRLFRNSRIIGRRFRLAHIYFQGGKIIEVATFRSQNGSDPDGGADGDLLIRDDNRFGSAEEDALRRDFTINALFYDLNNETVLDHAEGLADLRRGLVRTIGDATVRFREDPIRILRAIKFAARLDFTIERSTLQALTATRDEIHKAAAPRVLEEINRFCRGGAARRSFELLRQTGVFDVILPELSAAYGPVEGRGEENWRLLLALLEQIDRRHAEGTEAGSGEIVTCLLLPAIRERLGLSTDGTLTPPEGLDVRALVDEVMRPVAQRLRFPRRDLERCRLTVLTLLRMIASSGSGRSRRGGKRAILRRSCLPDALWILGVLARQWGGDLAQASASWERAAASVEPVAEPPRPRARGPRGDGPRRRSRGARGARDGEKSGRAGEGGQAGQRDESKARGGEPRRGRRGGGGREKDEGASAPRTAPRSADFFANLPTVPEIERDDGRGDRYGAGTVSRTQHPETAETAPAPAVESGSEGEREDRPRRRRSRRRGGARAKASAEAPTEATSEAPAETTTGASAGDAPEGAAAETGRSDEADAGTPRPRRRRRRSRRRRGGGRGDGRPEGSETDAPSKTVADGGDG